MQLTFVTIAAFSIFASACGSNNDGADGCAAAAARCDGSLDDAAADVAAPSDGTDADVARPVLALPGRIHLVNRGAVDVYLGLRFADRCAFDYALRGPDSTADGGTAPLIIEAPGCLCHPACDGCAAACATQSCSELCDQTPPRLPPGDEWVLAWDGRTFNFVTVCGGARCAEPAMATAGAYNLKVPLFDRAVAPDSGVAPAMTVEAEFLISSEGTGEADIEIPLGL